MEDIQEAHFYHEDSLPTQVPSPLIYEKSSLHLNLQPEVHSSNNTTRFEQLRRNNIPAEITSPDFGFLKLASPDLEKMLLAFQTGGAVSPTCQQHMTTKCSSGIPDNVDQSKGLAEALQDLHDRQDIPCAAQPMIAQQAYVPQLTEDNYIEENVGKVDQLYLTTDSSGVITVTNTREKFPDASLANTYFSLPSISKNDKQLNAGYVLHQYPTNSAFLPNATPAQVLTTPLRHPTDEPDTAAQLRALTAYNNVLASNSAFPSPVFKLDGASVFGDNPAGLQPIDLQMQEMVKRERKKQRNRVASSKCRKRKLEKEAVLETTVKSLKARNIELTSTANALKQQICELKQRVMDHVSEGCPITLEHDDDPSNDYLERDWSSALSENT